MDICCLEKYIYYQKTWGKKHGIFKLIISLSLLNIDTAHIYICKL